MLSMRRQLACLVVGIVAVFSARSVLAQQLDSVATSGHRSPGAIADEIHDPAERSAFRGLYKKSDPHKLLSMSEQFVQRYPQSAFLAPVLEIAAKASFDLGDYPRGLNYARQSLALLPENPLLLVAVADVQAGQGDNDSATSSARDALTYLDKFVHPNSIVEKDWPAVKLGLQATAYFVIGRAQLQLAQKEHSLLARTALIKQSQGALAHARSLKPEDQEVNYLQGVADLCANEINDAAQNFATVYLGRGELSRRAGEDLQRIYDATHPKKSFEDFARDAATVRSARVEEEALPPSAASVLSSEYAGSAACKECHGGVYRDWAESGMSKMFRPYQPENVLGDFETHNEFYANEDMEYLHGRLSKKQTARGELISRMVIRNGRHFFDIKQSDDRWHSYPVDYTIGSKWQQAYATKLPNGQIHVFPIQYNMLEKKWFNYWKSLDGPDTERSDPRNWEKLDDATQYETKCAVCHTSQLRNTAGGGMEGDSLKYREAGIGCEMCHGPSGQHIASITTGAVYAKRPIDPPVEFRKISSQDFVGICSQCHMQSMLRNPGPHGELNYATGGKFFQQNQSVPFGEFTRKGFYKDGRFSQTTFIVEALERSQCYRKGQASCGTCHDPHGHGFDTNRTSLKFKNRPDLMCVGCHSSFQDTAKAVSHTHHAIDSEGSRCVSCHMPPIMDALAFRARTHQIDDIPNAEMTIRFGQQESPNACLLCHAEKTPQWVRATLVAWKGNVAKDVAVSNHATDLSHPAN